MEKYKVPDHVFCLTVGGVYLYAILRAVLGATFIETTGLELYLIGIIALISMMVILFNYVTRIAAAGLVLLIGLFIFATWENFYEHYEHFYEVFLMMTGRLTFRPHLAPTVVWILSSLLAFATVVFTLHWFNFYVLAVGGAAVFLFTWLPGFSRDESAFFLFAAAFCMILIRKTNTSASAVFAAAPLCVAVIVFANIALPAESALYEQRHAGDTTRLNDFLYEIFNPAHFAFQQTGFSGPGGRLGGPVTPNSRYVMTVVAPGRTYLAGAISNEYTGSRWLRTLDDGDVYTHGFSPARFEMLETTAALIRGATHADYRERIQPAHLDIPPVETRRVQARDFPVMGVMAQIPFYWHTYLPLNFAEIRQAGSNRTGTVFRPPRAVHLWFMPGSPDYSDDIETLPTGDMQTPGFMSRGAAYQMQFLNVDTNLSFIEHILRGTGEGFYKNPPGPPWPTFLGRGDVHGFGAVVWGEERLEQRITAQRVFLTEPPISVAEFAALVEFYTPPEARVYPRYVSDTAHFMMLLDSFSRDILARYAREVRQHFMYVPDITPRRVHDLTHEITADAQTDFERVTAIREYLLQFPYTLDPEPVPRGVCFVDWFLFEGQEGYCTYFATAMAVMSRIAGVPSRYVEGFVLPPSADPEEPVRVSNRMAHAWAEVYLEGFGWHIMEATPTYAFLMNPLAPYSPQTAPGAGFMNPYWVQRMQELTPHFEMPYPDPTPPPFFAHHGEEEPEPENFFTPQSVSLLILVTIILAVPVLLAIFSLRAKFKLRRLKKSTPGEQVQIYFPSILGIAAQFTVPLKPFETEKNYGAHTGKRFAFRSDSVFFRDLIDLYYKAKYSPAEITQDEADLMREAHADMLRLLRQTRFKYVYFYLRHIRGIGKLK